MEWFGDILRLNLSWALEHRYYCLIMRPFSSKGVSIRWYSFFFGFCVRKPWHSKSSSWWRRKKKEKILHEEGSALALKGRVAWSSCASCCVVWYKIPRFHFPSARGHIRLNKFELRWRFQYFRIMFVEYELHIKLWRNNI